MAQKKNNKVSVATIEKIMKEHFGGEPKTFEWYGEEIEYKETLSLAEVIAFVDGVVDGCFDEDGDFQPELKNYYLNTYMVQLYTNIRMPQSVEKQYDILVTDLPVTLRNLIDERQYFEILEAIDEKIEYILQLDLQATRRNIMDLMKQFEDLGSRMEAMFEGVTSEDMGNIMQAINGMSIDEEKLVQAFLNDKEDEEKEEAVIEDEENKIVSIKRDDG